MKAIVVTTLFFLLVILSGYGQSSLPKTIAAADSLFAAQNWKMAKQGYESVLKDTTRNSIAWNKLGFADYNLKMYDAALKNYEKSMSQSPPRNLRPLLYSRIAKIHALKNNKPAAFTALDSATSLGYNNVSEMDTLSDFNTLRSDNYFKHIRDQVYLNRNPCMGDTHAREFDFWVGEWDAYQTGTNNYAGHSLIQMISGGCALLENWDSPGGSGKSINFIDPVTHKWKQSWAGSNAGGIQEFVNGEYNDGAMRFVFERTNAQGNKIIGRFIFYNQGPDQVRQFNETSADGGKTWTTSYDLTYMRKK